MNIKHYLIRKRMKKFSRLSSAAVVIGALRANYDIIHCRVSTSNNP